MIQIENTIISDDLIEERFCCYISDCKGICCVEGDSGAPVEAEELELLEKEYNAYKPYMNKKGIKEVERQGFAVKDDDGDLVTPLVNNKECAYTVFDEKGVASCAIEKAYRDGATSFQKPISCHLYPVRLSENKLSIAINYHKWSICKVARVYGDLNDIRLYKFLKEPLIRKFGKEWYEKLEFYAQNYTPHYR